MHTKNFSFKRGILLVLMGFAVSASSQQMPLLSGYYHTPWLSNPANTGINGNQVLLLGRSQWSKRQYGPETYLVSADGNFRGGKEGFGFMAFNDAVNILGRTGVNIALSHKFLLPFNSILSVGISGGFEKNKIITGRVMQELEREVMLPGNAEENSHFDGNFGLSYTISGLQIGFAGFRMFDNDKVLMQNTNPQYYDYLFHKHFVGSLTYKYDLMPGLLRVEPALQMRISELYNPQLDATMLLNIKNKYNIGGSYRQQYGYDVLAGVKLFDKISINYAFALAGDSNKNLYKNSHELSVGIRLKGRSVYDDGDKDGVTDYFDKEVSTIAGCNVNRKGVALDTDRDNVIDCLDKENNTPFGAQIDTLGVALDSDHDKVIDFYDQEENTPEGCIVDNSGVAVDANHNGVPDCKEEKVEIVENTPVKSEKPIEKEIDTDNDNIPDKDDKEPETEHWKHIGAEYSADASGCIVDLKGRAMDSDGDGVFDCVDDEVYSPKGVKVNNKGVAVADSKGIVPEQSEDTDGDGISDNLDLEPATPKGTSVDQWGRSPKKSSDPAAVHRISIDEVVDNSTEWDYYVIVGVFRYFNNLKNYQKYLMTTYGETTQVLVTDQDYYYVFTKRVVTKAEAKAETDRLNQKRLKDYIVGNPWLWRESKKR